ncbi:MAG: gamma carbonic anhydrase family protein [Woeseiaceae bacterium]|nr:gamma carbonic anhydrase family protein [Woeseiaceae bacterium]
MLGDGQFVADTAAVIGRVKLGSCASIWFNAVVRGDNEWIVIGDRSNVQDGSVLHADEGVPLTLGKDVTVGHKAMLHGCTIGDNSLIGIGSIVLNHAKVGRNCIVGANSLLTENKEFPDGVLILGSPAKVLRELTDEEIRYNAWSAEHYVENARRFSADLRQI